MKSVRYNSAKRPLQAELFPLQAGVIRGGPDQPASAQAPPDLASSKQALANAGKSIRSMQAVQRLWFCVSFPELSLAALRIGADTVVVSGDALQGASADLNAPLAITEQQAGAVQVLSANDAAKAHGVLAGMPVNAALALVPQLMLCERDEHAEKALLEYLVQQAMTLTPVVSVASSSAILLEMQGSISLFGGLESLLALVRQLFRGHALCLASSPVPQAALWLVQAGVEWHLQDTHDPRLKSLPVQALQWPQAVQQQFLRIGVKTLGECLRLPRDGFAKRFGIERLYEIDRGFGRMPDLRRACREQVRFDSLLELPIETGDYQQIAVVLHLQLEKLAIFLRSHQLAVQQFCISLMHRDFILEQGAQSSITDIQMDLLDPQPDTQGLAELIAVRFERLNLAAPVYAVQFRATAFFALSTQQRDSAFSFFSGNTAGTFSDPVRPVSSGVAAAGGLRLIELLRQRLGYQCVYSLSLKADHRPESAWIKTEPLREAEMGSPVGALTRPLWLLVQPQLLNTPDSVVGQPERIESGWWDGADMQRDYFRWQHRSGQRCWVFRDQTGWYLHGLFG